MKSCMIHYIAAFIVISTSFILLPVNGQCTAQGWEVAAEIQEIKNQQDIIIKSLQAVYRRLHEQDVYVKQLGIQNDAVCSTIVALDRRLNEHDIFLKNRTQSLWKLAIGLVFGIDDWIVIMNRFNGSVDFNRNWTDYRNGFGDKAGGEFWLGNEQVHSLTKTFNCILRIEVQLKTSGQWYYAEYSSFSLDSENNKYTIHISGFSGNAGDSITSTSLSSGGYLDGMNFTTRDSDNDGASDNCARLFQGGWWFNHCDYSCLTCVNDTRFYWYSLHHWEPNGLLRAARMMIKSK